MKGLLTEDDALSDYNATAETQPQVRCPWLWRLMTRRTRLARISHPINNALADNGFACIDVVVSRVIVDPQRPENAASSDNWPAIRSGPAKTPSPARAHEEFSLVEGFDECARDMRSAAKTPRTGGQDGPR